MKKNKGFTLAELLVVVAIIGVLVAVSIPIFTGQLEKARVATDKANVRAAKVAAVAEYLNAGATGEATYYYDAVSGAVKSSAENIKGYGKSTSTDTDAEGMPVSNGKAGLIRVEVTGDAEREPYKAYWMAGDGSGTGGSGSNDSGSSTGNAVDQAIDNSANVISWPVRTGTADVTMTTTVGNIYSYNGSYYVALIRKTYTDNQYYHGNPENLDFANELIKIDGKTARTCADEYIENGKTYIRMNQFDIYKDKNGDYYLMKGGTNAHYTSPDQEGSIGNDWVKINF